MRKVGLQVSGLAVGYTPVESMHDPIGGVQKADISLKGAEPHLPNSGS